MKETRDCVTVGNFFFCSEIETDEGFAAVRTEMYNLKLRARVEAQEERIRQLDEEKRRKEEKKAKQAVRSISGLAGLAIKS
jgi:hypothetical protein